MVNLRLLLLADFRIILSTRYCDANKSLTLHSRILNFRYLNPKKVAVCLWEQIV